MICKQDRLSLAWIASLMLVATVASAEQSRDIGDHVVHYNTMSTALLPPEVARTHGIQRSSSRALLNVAVLKKSDEDNDMPTPVTAEVTASTINMTGQRRNIRMREVTEQDAIYYIGTFRVHDEETLDFTVRVTPTHSDRAPSEIRFRQQFFVDRRQ
jgi:hypothetical protein